MIPENIKTRIIPNGRLWKQLVAVKQLVNDFPDSLYAKRTLKQFHQKFWYGSKRIRIYDIFNDAWSELLSEDMPEIIQIAGLKFVNDPAFKAEFSDIFIAGGALKNTNLEQEKSIACEVLSILSDEGPYENEYVKLRKDDIVIDAGANLGLFSLLCSQKDVKIIYAFEPQNAVTELLKSNILLNNLTDLIKIVGLGLSDRNDNYHLSHSGTGHSAASIVIKRNDENDTEIISCVTLDSWVRENGVSQIDFIKADIEGAERQMLAGATEILKKYGPRLAICTYHLPDDPIVLKNIIQKANPNYVIFQTTHKLLAYVP
jgi:FkbM family methyltransferase